MKIENNNEIKSDKFANYQSVQYMFEDYWFVIPKGEFEGYIVNSSGKQITNMKFTRYEGILDGDYELIYMTSCNDKSVLLNKKDFSVVINSDYCIVWSFQNGLAIVRNNEKYGYIDISGNVVIPIIYDNANPFVNETAKVKLNGETLYITKTNEILKKEAIPKELITNIQKAVSESEIIKAVQKEAERIKENVIKECEYIKKKAEIPSNILFSNYRFSKHLKDDLWAVCDFNERKCALIKNDGELITDFIYYSISLLMNFESGFLACLGDDKDYKIGIIDKYGNELIPVIYESWIGGLCDGLFCVKLNGKYGYINIKNETIIPFLYNNAECFVNGVAEVKLNKETFYINTKGEKVGNTSDMI